MSCIFLKSFGNRTLPPNKLLVGSTILERKSSDSISTV
jgi:hypothetical protein